MNEIATLKIRKLLRRGLPPKNSIPMRMPSKAGDDVAMRASLPCRKLEYLAQTRRSLLHETLREANRSIMVAKTFGMAQRQDEKRLVPRGLKRVIIADRESFERESQGFGILRESLCGPSENAPRELVQHDDERKTRPRVMPPCFELAGRRSFQQRYETQRDFGVRTAPKPPFDLSRDLRFIGKPLGWKPESENLLGEMHCR